MLEVLIDYAIGVFLQNQARSCYTNLVQVSSYQLAVGDGALAQEIGFWLINAEGLYPKAVCAMLPIRVTAEYADTEQE